MTCITTSPALEEALHHPNSNPYHWHIWFLTCTWQGSMKHLLVLRFCWITVLYTLQRNQEYRMGENQHTQKEAVRSLHRVIKQWGSPQTVLENWTLMPYSSVELWCAMFALRSHHGCVCLKSSVSNRLWNTLGCSKYFLRRHNNPPCQITESCYCVSWETKWLSNKETTDVKSLSLFFISGAGWNILPQPVKLSDSQHGFWENNERSWKLYVKQDRILLLPFPGWYDWLNV